MNLYLFNFSNLSYKILLKNKLESAILREFKMIFENLLAINKLLGKKSDKSLSYSILTCIINLRDT